MKKVSFVIFIICLFTLNIFGSRYIIKEQVIFMLM